MTEGLDLKSIDEKLEKLKKENRNLKRLLISLIVGVAIVILLLAVKIPMLLDKSDCGRYQIATPNSISVWIVDTKTGYARKFEQGATPQEVAPYKYVADIWH